MIHRQSESEIQTPRELLPGFYKQYHLNDDGGQSSHYVKIEFTKKIALYFPNSDARRKAVFKHDVHHIVTNYPSTFKGETEISAWEIASGCRHYWVAWVLDTHAAIIGLLFNPAGVYAAFVKGRRTKNLYSDIFTDEQLMDMPVSQIKENMLLNSYPENTKGSFIDFLLFLLFLFVGAIYSVLSLALLPFVLIYSVYINMSNTKRSAVHKMKY
jgi:hypothetical protein